MGCSSNPENLENNNNNINDDKNNINNNKDNNNGNDKNNNKNNNNNNNQLTEQTLTKVNNTKETEPKEPFNTLQTSKSTNLQKSTNSINKKPNPKKQISPTSFKLNLSNEVLSFKLDVSTFFKEELIPIWFEKDTYIRFITKAKWRIDKKYDFTDSRGMPSNTSSGFNYGAAVARIGSGPNFLLAPNEFTYFNENEGPLYLKMNLPKNIEVYPEGSFSIKIFDGKLMSMEEINSRLGWKEKDMNYLSKKSSELENDLTKDINDLRMNPILFYEKYMKGNSNIIQTEEFLKKMKSNNDNNQISAFSANDDLYNCLKKYIKINLQDIKINLNKRGFDKFMEKSKEKIHDYIKTTFGHECLVDCRKTKKFDSDEICMLYLLDINFRNHIFSSEYYSIAVNILEDILPDEIFIILVFMKD